MGERIKLKTALKNEKLISIYDSENTEFFKECYCPDPNCNSQLIARKGNIRTHHFAHRPDSPSCYGLETALHLKAKEIIKNLTALEIPDYTVTLDLCYHYFYEELSEIEKNNEFEIFSKVLRYNQFEYYPLTKYFNKIVGRFSFENMSVFEKKNIDLKKYIIKSEKLDGSIIPDITLINKKTSEKIYIEIGVTHLIDDNKRNIIKEKDLTVLEINFSKYYKLFNTPEDDLEEYFNNENKLKEKSTEKYFSINKRWINISKIGRFLDYEKQKIISEFTMVLKSLKNLYQKEILELFLDYLKSNQSLDDFNKKEFLASFKYNMLDKDIHDLLNNSVIFNYFKELSLKTPQADEIITKIKRIKQDRIDLHNRLWNN